MLLKLQAKPNANGTPKQLLIDTDAKTVQSGYFLFGAFSYTTKGLTQKQLDEIAQECKLNGYKKITD